LKLMDEVRHRRYTGVSNGRILENLKELAFRGVPVIIRVPVVPGINDSKENIREIGRFISALPNIRELELLPYHAAGVGKYQRLGMEFTLPEIPPISDAGLDRITVELQRYGITVRMGHELPGN
jgi:pyruvate formate lyase activating enzyme